MVFNLCVMFVCVVCVHRVVVPMCVHVCAVCCIYVGVFALSVFFFVLHIVCVLCSAF